MMTVGIKTLIREVEEEWEGVNGDENYEKDWMTYIYFHLDFSCNEFPNYNSLFSAVLSNLLKVKNLLNQIVNTHMLNSLICLLYYTLCSIIFENHKPLQFRTYSL